MGAKPIEKEILVRRFLDGVFAHQADNNGIIDNLHSIEAQQRLGYYRMGEVLMDLNIIEQIFSQGRSKKYRWFYPDQLIDDQMVKDVIKGMDKYRTHRRAVARATGKLKNDPDRTPETYFAEADLKTLKAIKRELASLRRNIIDLYNITRKIEGHLQHKAGNIITG